MSVGEIGWRFEQKILSSRERKGFSTRVAVYELDAFGEAPSADFSRLGLNYANQNYSSGNEIELLGDFSYKNFRKRWHAAFQSPVDWPFRYSTEYSFGAEDVPGDIRTNWELNRHYQFVVLAKSFYVTNNQAYLAELSDLFIDWNDHNPFMWGPEWSSPMEESIRLINWLFAAAFLEASEDTDAAELRKRLCAGAWCMAAHVRTTLAIRLPITTLLLRRRALRLRLSFSAKEIGWKRRSHSLNQRLCFRPTLME